MALLRPGDIFEYDDSTREVIGIYKSCDKCPENGTSHTQCKWTAGIFPRICIKDTLVRGRCVLCSICGPCTEIKGSFHNAIASIAMLVKHKRMKNLSARSNTYFQYGYASHGYAIQNEQQETVCLADFPEDAIFEEYVPVLSFMDMINVSMKNPEKQFETSALELPWFVGWDEENKILRMWRNAEPDETGDVRRLVAGGPLPIAEEYIMADWYEVAKSLTLRKSNCEARLS